jgi:hypothetical protein
VKIEKLAGYFPLPIHIAIDRTQWQDKNIVIALPINVRTLLNFVTQSKLTIAYCPLPIPVSSSAISVATFGF